MHSLIFCNGKFPLLPMLSWFRINTLYPVSSLSTWSVQQKNSEASWESSSAALHQPPALWKKEKPIFFPSSSLIFILYPTLFFVKRKAHIFCGRKRKKKYLTEMKAIYIINKVHRGVAKFGIAHGSGPWGLGFESRHSDQKERRNGSCVFLFCFWQMGYCWDIVDKL